MDLKLPIILENVLSNLGSGYKENIYQRAIEIELQNESISFQSEVICPILYQGIQVGYERADIVIYDNNKNIMGILELKSQTNNITKKEFLQLYKYLTNLNVESGYVINFIITLDAIISPNKYSIELYKLTKLNFNVEKYNFESKEYTEYKL
jgi:GxxExxY protein